MDETAQGEQAEPARDTGVTLQRPFIVALLYLLNIVLGFSVFVGLVLAYVWRSEADVQEWERTHYTYLIRTFWIGFAVAAAMMALWLGSFIAMAARDAGQSEPPSPAFFIVFFGGFVVWLALAGWFCARSIIAMVRAGERKPMPRPKTWLF